MLGTVGYLLATYFEGIVEILVVCRPNWIYKMGYHTNWLLLLFMGLPCTQTSQIQPWKLHNWPKVASVPKVFCKKRIQNFKGEGCKLLCSHPVLSGSYLLLCKPIAYIFQ